MGLFDKYTSNNSPEGLLELNREEAFGLICRFIYKFKPLSTSIFQLTLIKFNAAAIINANNLFDKLEDTISESSDEIIIASCKAHFKEEELMPLFAFLVDGAFSDGAVSKEEARRMNKVQEEFKISNSVAEKFIAIAKLKFAFEPMA